LATIRVFNHHVHKAIYRLVIADAFLFFMSFYLGTYLYFILEPGSLYDYINHVPMRAALFSTVTVISLLTMGLYQPRMREGASGILLRTIGGFIVVALAMSLIYYLLPDLFVWRGIFIYTALIAFIASLGSRLVFSNLIDLDQFKRRVLVLGTGHSAASITQSMRRKADRRGFTIVAFKKADGEESQVDPDRIVSPDCSLNEYARQMNIDEIVVALDDKRAGLPMQDLVECRMSGIVVVDIANFFEREAGKILVDYINPSWLIFSDGFRQSPISIISKRCFDISASLALLMVAWPMMLITAVAIWIEDGLGAPIFFRQERVGLNGATFHVLKFRSMTIDAEGDGKARWATPNDARITKVGSFIRKVRIDELPQILNVLKGDMAFIGPRPERPEFVKALAEKIPYFHVRHGVKPGITGWAQLLYPYGASEDDSRQKLQFDLYYVKNHSLFLDFMILLTTVEVVLFGKGAR
jgi:sugar transferase (PEP-CTERM system associated)